MITINTVQKMRQHIQQIKKNNQSIGYVATMGYLHEGHLELVKQAKANNDVVAMSIFVNPTQFGPNEDFDQYPRDFDRDKQLAEQHGVDILFHPSVSEMYPDEPVTEIHVVERTDVLCGKSRPGHFDGVATVLCKLFHIISPDHVYFGMKDAQQVAVVQGLINDYFFPLTLVPCPTVREEDGLAKSSRNVHLTPLERQEAPLLYKHLLEAKQKIEEGARDAGKIQKMLYDDLSKSISGKIDYLDILSYPDLLPLKDIYGKIIIALAVHYSKVRLIDNITWIVGEESKSCIAQ